ncbi:Exodeoxyribonuclease VII large subunit [Roseovarius nanhaiticus]|uniref:Exodeoxyribonuclease 7 large subunit n=1 Tax=Roseovarius nanhaiticus TaxID=573024 RepID=A0A1N7E7C1_9RHOB|nr:exodeoxyribonuclease VII large subunit [Roseovarius nanhaiticus]SEK80257.1 Exodeoxyribonuclease VII large subunit [Roseovarius nanhaiticus]SIR83898.1 Exodeoxyribonuclease VII large subunit [Roseovarius nanhaiticus]
MSDLIDDPDPGANAPEFSVSDLSGAIKRLIEGEFSFVRVKGEIGRVSRPKSGHIYLDLKDDRAVINGIIWKGVAGRLPVQPEEGMEVVATGRLTTFPGQSRYQIVIEDIKPAGAGALMAMLERRRAALAGEGLFDEGRKKRLPYLPEIIGVVTSPSGAVIRDILHRLRDRFPRKVIIWPVAVQGERCAPEVTRAIHGFNAMTPGGAMPRPDLIIVARGGGSIEDLWGFNEESVVRAAAASDIPLISAVGHETDTTLIDYASDKRAPTPTAAAELAVPVRLELLAWLDGQEGRLIQALSGGVAQRGQRLRDLARALPRPEVLLDGPRQRIDLWGDRLPAALIRGVQLRRVALSEAGGALRPGVLRRMIEGDTRRLRAASERMGGALERRTRDDRRRLDALAARFAARAPGEGVAARRAQMDRMNERLSAAGQRQIDGWAQRIAALDRLRETLGYRETLKRGYAVVRSDGALVTTRKEAKAAGALEIEFADGRLGIGGAAAPAPRKKDKPDAPDQGSLF